MKDIRYWKLIKDLYSRFMNDDLLSVGAQITYYLLLSLFPFLIFLINLISYTTVVNLLDNMEILSTVMPNNVYTLLRDIIYQAVAKRSGTLLSFGMLFALWSSSSGVSSIIRGINRAYDQEETRSFWRIWVVSIYFTFQLMIVILFSLVLVVFGKTLATYVFDFFGFSGLFQAIWNKIRLLIAFTTIVLCFVSLYHNTPNHKPGIKEVIPGGLFAAFGWVLSSIAFSFYVNNLGNYSNLYGSLGGIIALLTWIYLSSIIILLGAEINAALMFQKTGCKKSKLRKF